MYALYVVTCVKYLFEPLYLSPLDNKTLALILPYMIVLYHIYFLNFLVTVARRKIVR